jgi:ubiquinone/menaquinone biosynthesis C-methylase UbiE
MTGPLCAVLEYVRDLGSAIVEVYRVLKPRGVLLVSVPTNFPRGRDWQPRSRRSGEDVVS